MQTIQLNQGRSVILDDDDYALLSDHHWCYRGERGGSQGYAIRHVKLEKYKYRTQYLHREIMNPPPGMEVIFLNHDRLDCRRANLRVVTKEEARRHHRVRSDSKSGIKGVRYNPLSGTWSAFTYRDGHYHSMGAFWSKKEAIEAYDRALVHENPVLANPPERVTRQHDPTIDRHNPDKDPTAAIPMGI